jgi:hypothetical protein
MNFIFMIAALPLIALGITLVGKDNVRTVIDFSLAALLLISLVLMRSKVPLKIIPFVIVPLFGLYCLYLVYKGDNRLWTAVWVFIFPAVSIFLCKMAAGIF